MPWAELPAADESLTEICHIITDVARTSEGYYPRNYTMGYDKAKRLALWAAYPLHSCYTQGISRERHWGYDPTLAPGEQMAGGVSAPYNRGHQVANADRRVSNLANDQISYYSNMTAQRSNFNSGVWAALEGRVRGWMCADTLYVVTGCHFDGSQTSTIDNGGNTLPVPTQYYKVLLRSKNGSWHRFRPTNCRPSDSGTNTPNRRDRIRPVAPNRSRKSKDSADSNFSSTSPTPRKRVICPRTGAYDTRPKQEKALHGCVQGLFSHPAILVTSESETGSCARHAGRGGQPARGHIPAQRSIPGPAVVTTHAAHIHLVQTGKTATKSLKILR